MFTKRWPLVLMLPSVLLLSGCVPKPKQNYTVEQIPKIKDLKELMRVKAHTIDPWFAKREQTSFTDADYDTLIRVARTLKATTAAVRYRFSKDHPKGFTTLANKLEADAGQLETAAQSKASAEIGPSLEAMRSTCRSCHKEYK